MSILSSLLSFAFIPALLLVQDPRVNIASLPCDPKDMQPIVLGRTTPEVILAHRAVFKDRTGVLKISPASLNALKSIRNTYEIVVVFGSWCSDTQQHLPSILSMANVPSEKIKYYFIGVDRSKGVNLKDWPQHLPLQQTVRIPSVFIFSREPNGTFVFTNSIVEQPTSPNEMMCDSLLRILK